MSERITGSYDDALYKSTYTLLYFTRSAHTLGATCYIAWPWYWKYDQLEVIGNTSEYSHRQMIAVCACVLIENEAEGGSKSRQNRGRLRIRFDVDLPSSTDRQTELLVKSATLRLFKRRVRRRRLRPGDRLRVNVFQLLQDVEDVAGSRKRLVDSRVIETSADDVATWEEFDVVKAVEAWTDNPATNRGLVVDAELEDGIGRVRLSRVVEFVGPSASESGPTLSVMTRQRQRRRRGRRRRRQRRSTADDRQHADCRRGDGKTRCCRYPLWVSFREIGWDRWILAPDGYRAYYCDGACPPRHRVATHYAGIRALVNGIRPDAAPPPCCAATRMAPLTIAHYNRDGRAVVSVFDDMIVDECMCTWSPFPACCAPSSPTSVSVPPSVCGQLHRQRRREMRGE